MKKDSCQSCLMPFSQDLGQRENDQYCSLCYKDGKFRYEGNDVKEFQKMAYQAMRSRGMNILLAKVFAYTIRFAPRWKK